MGDYNMTPLVSTPANQPPGTPFQYQTMESGQLQSENRLM